MTRTAVIGSGIVGICCAIALADDGHEVVMIDRSTPAQETSRWNAGVMATSSVIPLSNPTIFEMLPRLLAGKHPGFRLNRANAYALLPWSLRFLHNSRVRRSEATVAALTELIGHARTCHKALCERAGFNQLHRSGWLMLYRGTTGLSRATAQAQMMTERSVAAYCLTADELALMEPHIAPSFTGAVHISESSHTDPNSLARAYLKLAGDIGVTGVRADIKAITRDDAGWHLDSPADRLGPYNQVVLALGPWTNDILSSVAKPLPIAIERGYLQTFACATPPTRPFFDVDAGYVAAMRPGGVQISSGTELTQLDSRPDPHMLRRAIPKAREALGLGAPLQPDIAFGNRPTLPDSLPVIGEVQDQPGLWIAAGHQHVGFNTSSSTASLLSALVRGAPCPINPKPFSPRRFGI